MGRGTGIVMPKWIVLQLIEKCNLRCKMCYQWGETGTYNEKQNLATLDYSVVQRVIKDCLPIKPYWGIFGGEPLMYRNLEGVIRAIKDGGCNIYIDTNGTLLEKNVEFIVESGLNLLWVSLDGTKDINDRQRGKGVFEKVQKGIKKLYEEKMLRRKILPKIGITFIVTPDNYLCIEELFTKSIDLNKIDYLSIEFQNYITLGAYNQYSNLLNNVFQIRSNSCAKSLIRDPAIFSSIDIKILTEQILNVKALCEKKGISLITQPKTICPDNYKSYFTANWKAMIDKKNRCPFPWMYAEIAATGDVTVCHTFYDLAVGNVYNDGILDIWKSEILKRQRSYLKKQLFPICTACCRYYIDRTKQSNIF